MKTCSVLEGRADHLTVPRSPERVHWNVARILLTVESILDALGIGFDIAGENMSNRLSGRLSAVTFRDRCNEDQYDSECKATGT